MRGEERLARGHALVYFRTADGTTLATYLVVPPVVIDLAKYMPPMFAGQLPAAGRADVAAMPMPPVPEEIEGGVASLERLAVTRDDDLIDGGSVPTGSVERLLFAAAEVGRAYGEAYQRRDFGDALPETADTSLAVDEVLMSLMGDHERIGEIAKLIGRLRYALDGNDSALAADTVSDMARIARHLPAKYRAEEVIAVAQLAGEKGARLIQLHLDRCFKLANEDYAAVARIESELRAITAPENSV
ncbi:MAG: hypothetical protein EPO26_09815 [Chloroflexota bacterium]|nr:MAG: hypothetical protein EPO26_09815 [Chloroflexota bacterium]